jgi:hypothetical protein
VKIRISLLILFSVHALNFILIVMLINYICIVFITSSVSFIVCGDLCYCVQCVLFVCCLTAIPLQPGKTPFAVKTNKNNNTDYPVFPMIPIISCSGCHAISFTCEQILMLRSCQLVLFKSPTCVPISIFIFSRHKGMS